MTDDPEPPARPLRRDAQERRAALIAAATECFERQGYGVPLETIAERAGVGRGTLYRNFRDREALALAIFEREIDRLDGRIDPDRPLADVIGAVVRDGARASALFGRIGAELRLDDENARAFGTLRDRLERMMTPAADAARARGELRPDAGPRELVLAIRMVGGLRQPIHDAADVEAQVAAALALLLNGLRPR